MFDEHQKQALDALEGLSRDDLNEVLGWLCSAQPAAVLAAVEGLHRHREVVAGLLQTTPPGS